MKDILKYPAALLHAITLSALFVPFVVMGDFSIKLFDIVKLGLVEYNDGSFEALIIEVLKEKIDIYAYAMIALIIITLFNTAMVIVLNAKTSYMYSVITGVVMSAVILISYGSVTARFEDYKNAWGFFLFADIKISAIPAIVIVVCYLGAIGLSVFGFVLSKSVQPSERRTNIIPPEEIPAVPNRGLVGEKDTKQPEKFYGGIKGGYGAFANKVFMLEELIPVYFVKKDQQILVMTQDSVMENMKNQMVDEIIAEVYYVPKYNEYVLTPQGMRKVFLSSGQPLGAGRNYYLPRATEIYCEKSNQNYILA